MKNNKTNQKFDNSILNKVINDISLRFNSSNNVQVERAVIKLEEWNVIRSHMNRTKNEEADT